SAAACASTNELQISFARLVCADLTFVVTGGARSREIEQRTINGEVTSVGQSKRRKPNSQHCRLAVFLCPSHISNVASDGASLRRQQHSAFRIQWINKSGVERAANLLVLRVQIAVKSDPHHPIYLDRVVNRFSRGGSQCRVEISRRQNNCQGEQVYENFFTSAVEHLPVVSFD